MKTYYTIQVGGKVYYEKGYSRAAVAKAHNVSLDQVARGKTSPTSHISKAGNKNWRNNFSNQQTSARNQTYSTSPKRLINPFAVIALVILIFFIIGIFSASI